MKTFFLLAICTCFSLVLYSQVSKTLTLTAGEISSVLSNAELSTITSLTIYGTIDASDFKIIRENMSKLTKLDLSNVTIMSYQGWEGTSIRDYYTYLIPAPIYLENEIPKDAFYDCNANLTILLPNTINSIAEYAFYSSNLLSIIIPSNISNIGNNAFEFCSAYITVHSDNPNYSSIDGVLFNKNKTSLIHCPVLKKGEYIIPNSVNLIKFRAFYDCSSLTSIFIPASVKVLEPEAFSKCRANIIVNANNQNYQCIDGVLFNIDQSSLIYCPVSKKGHYSVPNTVKSIENYSFYECSEIDSLIISEGVLYIGTEAFHFCSNLKSIVIPSSVKTTGSIPFAYCSGLEKIYALSSVPLSLNTVSLFIDPFYFSDEETCILFVPPSSTNAYRASNGWSKFINVKEIHGGFILSSDTLVSGKNKCTVTADLITSNNWAISSDQGWVKTNNLSGTGSTTLTFSIEPNSTQSTRKASITISSNVFPPQILTIFQEGDGLIVNTLPGQLATQLSKEQLNITSHLILEGTIDARDFKTMRDKMPQLSILDLSKVKVAAYSGTEGPVGEDFTVYPEDCIPSQSFCALQSNSLNRLSKIVFPISVNAIGDYAFLYTTRNLSNINIPSTITSIGIFCFTGCNGSILVDPNNPTFSSLDGVLYDKSKSVLLSCPVSKTGNFSIPNTVNTLAYGCFMLCEGLSSITIPSSVTKIESNAFAACKKLTSLEIPSSVNTIESWAFTNCTSLTNISLPSSLTFIDDYLMHFCTSLEHIVIPPTVTSIGEDAFYYCNKLKSLEIPSSVNSINSGAFYECTGLNYILAHSSIPIDLSFSNNIFPDAIKSRCSLIVPKGSKGAYQIAPEWKEFTNIQENPFLYMPNNYIVIGATDNINSTFSLVSNTNWHISSDQNWLSISPGAGNSSAVISLTSVPNNSTSIRTATLTISSDGSGDQYILIAQLPISLSNKPVANAGTDQSVSEGTMVTLDGSASSDADGNALSYLWTAPEGITLNSATAAQPTFIAPEVTVDKTYTFSLVVNDGSLNSVADQVVVMVKNVNKTPLANAGTDQSVSEGASVTLDGSASSDPDNDALTYLWTAPSGIILSSTTAVKPTFTAPEVMVNTNYTFTLVVNDGSLSSVADQIVITVKQINKAPVAIAGIDQSVNENGLFTLDGSASSDPDIDALTYLWTAPPGIILSSTTAVKPTFTAPEVMVNTNYTFTLVVNDGSLSSVADQIVITVKQINKAPVANAGIDQSVNENGLFTLDGSASSDPDNDALTYYWTAPPGIILSSAIAAKPTFTAPEVMTNTNYTFTLVVNDGSLSSVADQIVITVKQINKAPVANAGIDQSVNENGLFTLDGSASSDPDNDALTYYWTAPPGIILSSTTAAMPTFTAPEVSLNTNYIFSLVVNDGIADSPTDQVTITVKQGNKEPVANAGIYQSVDEGTSVNLDGKASSDPDNDPLTYLWTEPTGITLSSTSAAQPTFIAPEVTEDKTYTFSLVVNDGTLNSVADEVVVTVKDVNKKPLANAGTDQSASEGTTVTLDGTASLDADGDALTYLWTAPEGITLNSATVAQPTFTAPEVTADKTYTFSLLVNDGTVSSTIDVVVVSVLHVDKAPYVKNLISNISLFNGASDQIINLKTIFTDDDLEDLQSYLITSNTNDQIVTATITESDLILHFSTMNNGFSEIEVSVISNGKHATTKFKVEIIVINNIEPILYYQQYTIYPNPTSGKVKLVFSKVPPNGTYLTVVNVTGKTILKQIIQNKEELIDLKGNPPGVYLIKTNMKEGKVQRVILM